MSLPMFAEVPYPPQPGGATPTAPPPVAPPAGYHAPQPAQPPKKRRGCAITIVLIVFLLCACCCGGGFALSLLTKPKDLGVTYTEADYWSAVAKSGVDFSGLESGRDPSAQQVAYEGSIPIDATFTAAEMSALVSYSHMSGWPVHDAQIRFNGGNNLEVSGRASYGGVDYVFYVDADADVSGKTVTGSANSAEVFGVSVPADLIAQGEPKALEIINDRLARMDGLDIQTAEIVDGQLRLAGMVPAKVYATSE